MNFLTFQDVTWACTCPHLLPSNQEKMIILLFGIGPSPCALDLNEHFTSPPKPGPGSIYHHHSLVCRDSYPSPSPEPKSVFIYLCCFVKGGKTISPWTSNDTSSLSLPLRPSASFHSLSSCCILPSAPHCAMKSTPPKTWWSLAAKFRGEFFGPDFGPSLASDIDRCPSWASQPPDAMASFLLAFPKWRIQTTDDRRGNFRCCKSTTRAGYTV